MTKESPPRELEDYWDDYFENTFKPYIKKKSQQNIHVLEENVKKIFNGKKTINNYFFTDVEGYFTQQYKQNILERHIIENDLFKDFCKLCKNDPTLIKSTFNKFASKGPEYFYKALEDFKPTHYCDKEILNLCRDMIPHFKEIDFIITNFSQDKSYIKEEVIKNLAYQNFATLQNASLIICDKKDYQTLATQSIIAYNFILFEKLIARGHIPFERDKEKDVDTLEFLFQHMDTYCSEETQFNIVKHLVTHISERTIESIKALKPEQQNKFKKIVDSYSINQKLSRELDNIFLVMFVKNFAIDNV